MSSLIDIAPRWHYAGVLVLCLVLTAPLEFVIGARVYRRPMALLVALTGAIPFLLWDAAFTRAGVWWFGEQHLLGLSIGNLPIEEVAFFVVIPICGLLTYEAVRMLSRRRGAPE